MSLTLNLDYALAQKIKIKKVKGRSALIETSIPLEEGKVYDLQSDLISTDVNYSNTGFKSRQNSFTIGGNFSYLKNSNTTLTAYSLQGRYGWNFSYVEFGLVGQVDYIDKGAGSATNLTGGGYIDYNLVTNRDSKNLIYGPFGLLLIGSAQSLSGTSSNLIDVNAGGFITWFFSQSNTALRAEAYLDNQQVSSNSNQTNSTGIGSRGLLLVYF